MLLDRFRSLSFGLKTIFLIEMFFSIYGSYAITLSLLELDWFGTLHNLLPVSSIVLVILMLRHVSWTWIFGVIHNILTLLTLYIFRLDVNEKAQETISSLRSQGIDLSGIFISNYLEYVTDIFISLNILIAVFSFICILLFIKSKSFFEGKPVILRSNLLSYFFKIFALSLLALVSLVSYFWFKLQ